MAWRSAAPTPCLRRRSSIMAVSPFSRPRAFWPRVASPYAMSFTAEVTSGCNTCPTRSDPVLRCLFTLDTGVIKAVTTVLAGGHAPAHGFGLAPVSVNNPLFGIRGSRQKGLHDIAAFGAQ